MSNKITIHQAFYGEVQRSHGRVWASFEDADLNSFLVGFTDRPSSLPAGLVLSPYYSAVAFKEYYIITLTFPDPGAQRGGMVFTHALILKIADLQNINDFDQLLHYFISHIPQDKTGIDVIQADKSVFVSKPKGTLIYPGYTQQLLTHLEAGKYPILFCGSLKNFADSITVVWNGLPSGFRKHISFTAGFSVASLDQAKTVVYFQPDLEQSIKNHEYISDKGDEIVEPVSTLEKYILDPVGSNRFSEFVKELDIELDDWETLQLSVKAYDAFRKLDTVSVEAVRQLSRQIAKLSPNAANGKIVKQEIIGRLRSNIESGSDRNFKSFKNFPTAAFQDGEKEIKSTLEKSIENEFAKTSGFDQELVSDLIVGLQGAEVKNWWHHTLEIALANVIKSMSQTAYENIWKLFVNTAVLTKTLLDLFPEDKKYETSLLESRLENIPNEIAKEVCAVSAKRSWLLLHANLIGVFCTMEDAIDSQLALEDKAKDVQHKGAKVLLSDCTDADLLKITLKNKHGFLIDHYGKKAAQNASLLNGLDVSSQTWLAVWLVSLRVTEDLGHGLSAVGETVNKVLDEILSGKEIPAELFEFIGKSQFADIYSYKNRKEVWKKLPVAERNLFLAATANKLLLSLAAGDEIDEKIEPELSLFIANNKFLSALLENYKDNIKVVIEVYELVSGLNDAYLADYIRYYRYSLSDQLSRRLGDMIQRSKLRLTASQVFEKAKHDDNFRLALLGCASLCDLSIWDKLKWGWLLSDHAPKNEFSQALFETALELYDKGPEDRDIWKRAGGKVSHLHHHSSREQNWREAIALLQNGGGGKHIDVQSLIKAMLEDYPNHEGLKEMEKYLKSNR